MDRTTKFMAIVIMVVLIVVLFTLMPAEGMAQAGPGDPTPTVPPIWVTTEPTYPQPPTAQPPVGYPGPDGPAPAASSIYLPIVSGG